MKKKEIKYGITHELVSRTEEYEHLLNLETGNIETRFFVDLDKYKVISKEEYAKRKNYYKQLEILEERRRQAELFAEDTRGEFYMQTMGSNVERRPSEVKRIVQGITLTEEGYFIEMLSNYFLSTHKPLSKRVKRVGQLNDDYVPMKNSDLIECFNLSKGRVSQLIKTFFNAELITQKEGKDGWYVSEKFFKKNTRSKGEYVVRVYFKKLNEVINEIKEKVKDKNEQYTCIGLINRLGYFVHYQTYYLCLNPDDNILLSNDEKVEDAIERNPQAMRYLKTRELLLALGDGGKAVNIETLKYRLHVLLAAGVLTGTVGAGAVFRIHPDLMNRSFNDGGDSYTKSVKRDFKVTSSKELEPEIKEERERQKLKSKEYKRKYLENKSQSENL